jgi:hypothetical protein
MGTPDAAPRLRWLFRVLAVIVSSTIALAAAELAARARGHRPRLPATRGLEPPSHVADPTLGWRPAPGRYQFGPYAPGAAPVTVTIRADGARETGIAGAEGRPELLLIGCSFTMGWAVSDNETFAARVQSQRPDLEVVNHGVGAYGTLQSLMVLEKLLLEEGRRPAWVLYGYFTHHDVRYLLFSYSGGSRMLAEPNDGVVTLASELDPRAQQQAVKVYGFAESHAGILGSAGVSALVNGLLTTAAH